MFFEDAKALSNVPEISVKSSDGKSIRVIAKNVGTTTLQYVVDFWDADEQERMLANFSEKDTNRSGLVILATEPDK